MIVRSANASITSKKSCLSQNTVNRLMQLSSADHVFRTRAKFGFTSGHDSEEEEDATAMAPASTRGSLERMEAVKQSRQLKKIQWLIQQCRMFFMHMQDRLHLRRCANQVYRRMYLQKVMTGRWKQWRHLYKKALQQNDLLDSIYHIKRVRSIFYAWEAVVADKLKASKQAVSNWYQKTQRKKVIQQWRCCWLEQRRVKDYQKQLFSSQKRRIFKSWCKYSIQQRRYRATLFILKRRLVQPWWINWRRKVSHTTHYLSYQICH